MKKTQKNNFKFRKESWVCWTKCNDSRKNTMKFYLEKDKLTANKKNSIHNWQKRGKNSHLNSTVIPFQTKSSEKIFPAVKDN
jgi:hypothetical protein